MADLVREFHDGSQPVASAVGHFIYAILEIPISTKDLTVASVGGHITFTDDPDLGENRAVIGVVIVLNLRDQTNLIGISFEYQFML
jgi:hypothetical protein